MNKTILIVDDSPLQAIMLRRTLANAGFDVITVKSGNDALEKMKQQSIDLIISDVSMPDLDGYQLCKIIKNDKNTSSIPLILCTSLSDPENLIKGIEAGANNYITKPWDDENLRKIVDELLQNHSLFIKLSVNSEEIIFNGVKYKIATSKQDILNFLLSTYQNIHKKNAELIKLREQIEKTNTQLQIAQKEQAQILHNIFPDSVAQELIAYGAASPLRYEDATVMFIDFVGFSKATLDMNPKQLVEILSFHFERFDEIIDQHNLERIKTMGDGYMCAGGIPNPNNDHAINCAMAALDILKFIEDSADHLKSSYNIHFDVRIGIHSGPVIAGVVGKKRLAFDIWGETVNLASRMESHSLPNKINISNPTYEKIKNFFNVTPRGTVKVKNKEGIEEIDIEMYFIDSLK